MQAPDISVILPFFNAEKTIARALGSILSSTHRNIEVIAVDDGSYDSSPDICQKIAKSDTRLKIIRKKKAGVSSARNAGIEAALGNFFTFVDADDEVDCEIYQKMLFAAQKYGADLVQCATLIVNGSETTVANAPRRDTLWELGTPLPTKYFSYACWGKIYLKERFGNLRFDQSLRVGEDLRFNLEVMALAQRAVFLQEALYLYIQSGESAMSQLIERRTAEEFGNMIEDAEMLFGSHTAIHGIIKAAKIKNFAHVFSLSASENSEYCKVLFAKTREKARKSIKDALTCRGISVKKRIAILLAIFLPRIYKRVILEKRKLEEKRKRNRENTP